MKFFKHFVDAHRGGSMQNLMAHMNHTGIACYWILVEMCAEKLEKERSEEFTEAHCHFTFHEKVLRQNLRISRTKLEIFLGFCSGFSLLSFKKVEQTFEIHMPKLLECMDRDTKKARPERVQSAPKIKKKIKKEDKEYTREFLSVWEIYPRRIGKTDAFKAFLANVPSDEIPLAIRAVENYRAFLKKSATEEKFVKHPSTFFNQGRWRDWLDPAHGSGEDFSTESAIDWGEVFKTPGVAK